WGIARCPGAHADGRDRPCAALISPRSSEFRAAIRLNYRYSPGGVTQRLFLTRQDPPRFVLVARATRAALASIVVEHRPEFNHCRPAGFLYPTIGSSTLNHCCGAKKCPSCRIHQLDGIQNA